MKRHTVRITGATVRLRWEALNGLEVLSRSGDSYERAKAQMAGEMEMRPMWQVLQTEADPRLARRGASENELSAEEWRAMQK